MRHTCAANCVNPNTLSLSRSQAAQLGEVLASLGVAEVVTEQTLVLLQRLLLWPDEKVFPVIDLAKKLANAPTMGAQNAVRPHAHK